MWSGAQRSFKAVSYGSDDYAVAEAFRRNLWLTSVFKAHSFGQNINAVLFDKEGELVSFDQFRTRALALNREYNVNWLATEYRTAVKSAQDGIKWTKLVDEKSLFPYLEYRSTRDGRVRDEHAVFDGIIKPVDSPFWDTYYPPNGFNCRCRIIQRESGPATRTPSNLPPPDSPLFEQNVGKTGEPFPTKGKNKHPYFKGVPADKKAQLSSKSVKYDGDEFIPNNLKKRLPEVTAPPAGLFWSKFKELVPLQITPKKSYYAPYDKKVRIGRGHLQDNVKTRQRVAFHKYGHALDDQIGWTRSGAYELPMAKIENLVRKRARVESDFADFLGEAGAGKAGGASKGLYNNLQHAILWAEYTDPNIKLADWLKGVKAGNLERYERGDQIRKLLKKPPTWLSKALKYAEGKDWTVTDFKSNWTGFADIAAQATKGEIGRGHGKGYWASEAGPWEYFAHVSEARFVPETREFWEILSPEITKIVVKSGEEFYK